MWFIIYTSVNSCLWVFNDFSIFIVTLIDNTYMNYYIFTLAPLIPCNPGKPGGPEEIHKYRMHVAYNVAIDH